MSKNKLKIGQLWKSKLSYPGVGHYTIQITSMSIELVDAGFETVETKFTASEWKDGHWVENHAMTIDKILNDYEPIEE